MQQVFLQNSATSSTIVILAFVFRATGRAPSRLRVETALPGRLLRRRHCQFSSKMR
jgi:hypothetical protein